MRDSCHPGLCSINIRQGLDQLNKNDLCLLQFQRADLSVSRASSPSSVLFMSIAGILTESLYVGLAVPGLSFS